MTEHPITLVVTGLAKLATSAPELVRVEEYRRDAGYLQLHVYPGSEDNAGAIIGRRGETIERIRALVEELAGSRGMVVKVKVVSPVGAHEGSSR